MLNKFKSTKSFNLTKMNPLERLIAINTFSHHNKYQKKLLKTCYKKGLITDYSSCTNNFTIGFLLSKENTLINVFLDILINNYAQVLLDVDGPPNRLYDDTPSILIGTSIRKEDYLSSDEVNNIIKETLNNLNNKNYHYNKTLSKIFIIFNLLKGKETITSLRIYHLKNNKYLFQIEIPKNYNYRTRDYLIKLFKDNNIPRIDIVKTIGGENPYINYGFEEDNLSLLDKDLDKIINTLKKYNLPLSKEITADMNYKLKRLINRRINN